MTDIIILLLINSFLCFGFFNACHHVKAGSSIYENGITTIIGKDIKGVLWFIEKWAKDKWFHKPLCGCLPCMASFHSIHPYWTYMYATNSININALLFYPVYILALSGLNYLIDEFI